MNGEPLSLAHGAPLRLIVPGWAGDHWIDRLLDLRVQKEEAEGFYFQTAYRLPIEPVSPGTAVPPDKTRPLTTFPVKSIHRASGRRGPAEGRCPGNHRSRLLRREAHRQGRGQPRRRRFVAAAALEGEAGAGRWQQYVLLNRRSCCQRPAPASPSSAAVCHEAPPSRLTSTLPMGLSPEKATPVNTWTPTLRWLPSTGRAIIDFTGNVVSGRVLSGGAGGPRRGSVRRSADDRRSGNQAGFGLFLLDAQMGEPFDPVIAGPPGHDEAKGRAV